MQRLYLNMKLSFSRKLITKPNREIQLNHLVLFKKHNIIYQKQDVKFISHLSSKEFNIPVPWGHIAAKSWGNPNGQPVLAVHGLLENLGSFETLAPLLPDSWYFVAVDLAGHGLSSHLPPLMVYDKFCYLLQLRLIAEYMKWVNFSFIGHSLGAGISLLFAALYPKMIKRVISLDFVKLLSAHNSEHYADNIFTSLEQHISFLKDKRQPRSYTLNDATKRLIDSTHGSVNFASAAILMKRGTRPDPHNPANVIFTRDYRLQVFTIPIISTEYFKQLCSRMASNILIIKAKDGSRFESQSLYDEFLTIYKQSCPKFAYVQIPGTHHVHLNNPEEIVSHIINFIQE